MTATSMTAIQKPTIRRYTTATLVQLAAGAI